MDSLGRVRVQGQFSGPQVFSGCSVRDNFTTKNGPLQATAVQLLNRCEALSFSVCGFGTEFSFATFKPAGLKSVLESGIHGAELPAEPGWGCDCTCRPAFAWRRAGVWRWLPESNLTDFHATGQLDRSRVLLDSVSVCPPYGRQAASTCLGDHRGRSIRRRRLH